MLTKTPFLLFQADTIDAFIQDSTGKREIIATGNSLGKWKLLYIIFAVDKRTRAIVIPTYNTDLVFYDQTTKEGEIDIDSILERAESEHTRLIADGAIRIPERLKCIRIPIGEYREQTKPHQSEHYTFYEAILPIAGSNNTPRRIVAYAKWKTREPNSPPLEYGIELPEDTIGQIAWLCCQDDPPAKHDKTLVVYEDFSAELEISENVTLRFPPNTYQISEGEQHRFE